MQSSIFNLPIIICHYRESTWGDAVSIAANSFASLVRRSAPHTGGTRGARARRPLWISILLLSRFLHRSFFRGIVRSISLTGDRRIFTRMKTCRASSLRAGANRSRRPRAISLDTPKKAVRRNISHAQRSVFRIVIGSRDSILVAVICVSRQSPKALELSFTPLPLPASRRFRAAARSDKLYLFITALRSVSSCVSRAAATVTRL